VTGLIELNSPKPLELDLNPGYCQNWTELLDIQLASELVSVNEEKASHLVLEITSYLRSENTGFARMVHTHGNM
jgi:hypothetical protein